MFGGESMKLIVISLLSFFWTLSAYADLQWVSYNPAGDYGDKVPVISLKAVIDDQQILSSGICRTLDARGEVRVGRVSDHKCHYAMDLFIHNTVKNSGKVPIDENGTSDKFDVLVALSHNDYIWIDIGPDDDLKDSILPFNVADDGSSQEIYICRHMITEYTRRQERAVVYFVIQSYEDIDKSKCYYEYFSNGRKKVLYQILSPVPMT